MFETARREGIGRLRHAGTGARGSDARWLATGPCGGLTWGAVADNVTVPDGFERTDLAAYVRERRGAADLDGDGPALLTGVDQRHARRARSGPVTVVATAGLSNPASLPVLETEPTGSADQSSAPEPTDGTDWRPGTVNLLVGVDRSLGDGTLVELLSTCVEAKAATLVAVAGVPGTTSDAIAVGCAPDAEPEAFAGSATSIGAAARACVRDAVCASLDARYDDVRGAVADADHGVRTSRSTETGRL